MKVAYVITRSDSIGGAHVHVRDMAARLIADGHDATVLVGGEGPFTQQLAQRGIDYIPLTYLTRAISPSRDLRALKELRRALAALKPDLVSTHSSKAGLLGRVAACRVGVPVLFTAHGWAFTDGIPKRRRRLYLLAEQWAARYGAKTITVSHYDQQLALAHGVGRQDRLVAIHNGMPDIGERLRARPAADPPRVIMVARFEEQKDHGTLLAALAALRDVPWTAELVGDGPQRPAMEGLAASLGIGHRVEFPGAVGDVNERLAGAHVFALISRWEGLPRSILEAMRAGLPVIASDVGGVSETVIDGTTGLLVPRGDAQAVECQLKCLLTSGQRRVSMGAQGRALFEERFTFDRMFLATMGVYRDVLAEAERGTYRATS